ncbi:MAG: DNA topoisomerase VI subunit B, partial [Deltaproteobacteria bacterium]|nr:DNA topoisomerase VI subunit B [Deltaproteobacteria bacterium]
RLRRKGEGRPRSEKPAELLRFANRVPLLYQQGHCAMTRAVRATNWRHYGLEQDRGGMPRGPLTLMIHMASVWVPFTSESKEAIAGYSEIEHEVGLALNECGRRLATVLRREKALELELRRRNEIERYLPHVGDALAEILDWSEDQREGAIAAMDEAVHRSRSVP